MVECKKNVGRYIRRWCFLHSVSKSEFRDGIGLSKGVDPFKYEGVSLKRYFAICEFMSERSSLPVEFYMHRIKSVLQGDYQWER